MGRVNRGARSETWMSVDGLPGEFAARHVPTSNLGIDGAVRSLIWLLWGDGDGQWSVRDGCGGINNKGKRKRNKKPLSASAALCGRQTRRLLADPAATYRDEATSGYLYTQTDTKIRKERESDTKGSLYSSASRQRCTRNRRQSTHSPSDSLALSVSLSRAAAWPPHLQAQVAPVPADHPSVRPSVRRLYQIISTTGTQRDFEKKKRETEKGRPRGRRTLSRTRASPPRTMPRGNVRRETEGRQSQGRTDRTAPVAWVACGRWRFII
ncbi:uncharacterized protein J3D65DRAFT_133618 [Phyllosticta citribraziliensis]|uniref:Uncharacterized protein n=1 Tax=Phyllosticta citribraziliensis TaxID=989973 RepID=A0ABR1L8I7_9PEZI